MDMSADLRLFITNLICDSRAEHVVDLKLKATNVSSKKSGNTVLKKLVMLAI